jgi:uncharacterized membrane protein
VTPVRGWVVATTWLLSFVGLGISIYLTIAHFEGTQILACPTGGGVIDCAAVTTSPQSYFFGIPVAILGLAQYTGMVVINSPWLWRSRFQIVHLVRFAMGAIGVGFILWLIYAEAILIGHFCEWCSGVHLITIILFLVLTRASPQQLGWIRGSEPAPAAPPR